MGSSTKTKTDENREEWRYKMKKRRMRIMACVLCASMSLGMLAGCGSKEDSGDGGSGEKVTLTLAASQNWITDVDRELAEALGQKDAEIEVCRQNLDNSNEKIKELEQKIDRLQVAGAFEASAADVKEARQNIARLVREIDKCITLLND